MNTLFKSDTLANEFATNGYVVLDFLSTNEVQEISALFQKYKPRVGNYHIYSNLEDNDLDTNIAIENKIKETFQKSIDKYFQNYTIYGGSYLVKGLGENSATTLHQDWNIVDESKDISFTIWVPMIDVDENNGCLQVIPGSHRWFSTIRSSNIPSLYLNFDSAIESNLVSLPVKAGTAVVFAFNLFHGSKQNKTSDLRRAVHLALVNQHAEIIHYVKDKNTGEILKVVCDKEFLYKEIFNISKGNMPERLNVLETISYKESFTITEEVFFQKLNAGFATPE